jgi:hypothetical protein
MSKPAKYNWEKLKQDFILGDYKNLKEFAKKKNLNYTSGAFKKATTGWQKLKKNNKQNKSKKVIEKVTEKIAAKEAKKIANGMTTELEAAELISQVVLNALKDPAQFNRHLVQHRSRTGSKNNFVDVQWTEEQQFNVVDSRRLKDLAGALQTSTAIQRLLKGLLSEAEKQQLALEREKLDLERAKANLGLDEDDETGVVVLPEIDYSLQNGGESIEQSGDTKEKDIQS